MKNIKSLVRFLKDRFRNHRDLLYIEIAMFVYIIFGLYLLLKFRDIFY